MRDVCLNHPLTSLLTHNSTFLTYSSYRESHEKRRLTNSRITHQDYLDESISISVWYETVR